MDFLAPRSSRLQSSQGIDLPLLLGSCLRPPFPAICTELAGLVGAVRAQRNELSKCIRVLLFGSLDDDGTPNANGTLSGDIPREPSDFLFGSSKLPIEDAPHGKLTCSRELGKDLHFETAGLRDLPCGSAAPQSPPRKLGGSYGDAWLAALHLKTEPSANEIQLSWAMGSHADLIPLILDLISGVTASLGMVTSGCSDTDQLAAAYRKSFPNLASYYHRFFRLDDVQIDVERGQRTGEPARLTFDFPMDFVSIQQHYDRFAELLQHFERLQLTVQHPDDSGLLLIQILLQDEHLQATLAARDGRLAWWSSVPSAAPPTADCRRDGSDRADGRSKAGDLIAWSEQGAFTADLVVESSMKLLGLNAAAVPLPLLRFRCLFERNLAGPGGSLSASCVEVGEVLLEHLASFIFDVAQFRELVLERLCFQSVHRHAGSDGDDWLVYSFLRLPFPTTGLAAMFVTYFRQLLARQVQEMQILGAIHDFFVALAEDSTAIGRTGVAEKIKGV